jgi:hypothetical protein
MTAVAESANGIRDSESEQERARELRARIIMGARIVL